MDIETLLLTNAGSLIVGLVGGYALQFLAARRAERERKVLRDVATLERCVQIFNARVEFIIAYHTRPAQKAKRQEEYQALYYGNLDALPESFVDDETWQLWMRAEADARDRTRPEKDRMKQVTDARWAVLQWLAARRRELAD
jgi:hypothetical protein